jgi:hypothetical protein
VFHLGTPLFLQTGVVGLLVVSHTCPVDWIHEKWSDRMRMVCVFDYSNFRFCAVQLPDFSSNFARPAWHRKFSVLQIVKVPSASLPSLWWTASSCLRATHEADLHFEGLIILSFGRSARVYSGPSLMMCETSF